MTGADRAAVARVGVGYDSHRLVAGDGVLLCGVRIPAPWRLDGHSDADAAAHAVTDAILGAAGAGDIGELFPDTDPANAGRDSMEMLSLAREHVAARGFVVGNVDITVVAQSVRIRPHADAMRESLARALSVDAADVSVKGKTNERMGWIGRDEGIACIAVATVIRG